MAYYYWTDLDMVLQQWQQLGLFKVILPFLLIFALVYAILETTPIFGKNKGVHSVISIAIGLLSLQFEVVSKFFEGFFPALAVGLAIILGFLILVGLFITDDTKHVWNIILGSMAGITGIVVLIKAYEYFRGGFISEAFWWQQNLPSVVLGVIVVGAFVAVILSSRRKEEQPEIKIPTK